MAARAEASERLSGQIVASLTAGLVVTDLDGRVQIVNPSSRRLLGLGDGPLEGTVRDVLGAASPLTAVIEECLRDRQPIVRRALELADPRTAVTHLGVTVSPLVERDRDAERRDLPVHRPERHRRPRGAVAPEGHAGAAGRADGGTGARIPQRAGDRPRLRAPDEPRHAAAAGAQVRARAFAPRPRRWDRWSPTSSTSRGPTQLAVTPVDLGQIAAARRRGDCRPMSCARGGRLAVSGTWAVVDGDEVLLRQALSNLARNAVEACAAGGDRARRPASTPRPTPRPSAARAGHRQRARHRARAARARVPPVLHDQARRHRPRPGAGAEDRRHAQRPGPGRARPGGAWHEHAR